jgi:hypothetical protein
MAAALLIMSRIIGVLTELFVGHTDSKAAKATDIGTGQKGIPHRFGLVIMFALAIRSIRAPHTLLALIRVR